MSDDDIVLLWFLGKLNQAHLDVAYQADKIDDVTYDTLTRCDHRAWLRSDRQQMLLIGSGLLTFDVMAKLLQARRVPRPVAESLMESLRAIKNA